MMTSAEIRKHFLDFFVSKQHTIVPSAPIVVKNDPTLLFTNAGMNQFKDYFLGNKNPEHTRVADTQKCLRVSGKHNDLEEVGVDTYHHTMFEMLGNWSFGDYFKAEAIAWSWELLTEVYKIPKDKLYVSVFEGDEKEGLPASTIALREWQKLVAEDHIVYGNKKDNFWEMGDTGPCGPCSEIHVDMRPDEERALVPGRDLVNKDHPQVIEIWNNVFIQFNRLKNGSLEPLPFKHVDTGMGFERLVRVIQQKTSNYDTDIFTGTIAAVEKITGKHYDNSDTKQAISFRVIADHIRAIAFTIADGQLPSNTGAGYVIRRILRRAVRYYYSYLNYQQPLLHKLLPILAEQFKDVFPELINQLDFVEKVVKEEEDAFLRTLEKGISRFNDYIKFRESYPNATQVYSTKFGDNPYTLNKEGTRFEFDESKVPEVKDGVIPGKIAFELIDTYGFPIDLTQLMASEIGWKVDEAAFESEMLQQKNRSRAATTLDTEDWILLDDYAMNEFVGYDSLEIKSKVVKYRKVTGKGKDGYQLVLEATPFYAESGGQVGDKGVVVFNNEVITVYDTKRENNLIIHFTETLPVAISGQVVAKVDIEGRKNIESHHTATHLLHAALRQVLGKHVAQKGSLVNAEHLRFDFSHFSKVTLEETQEIERIVNEKIRANIPVVIKVMEKDEAIGLGAMALFGEKYGNQVRVVIIDPEYSIELCGGTHAGTTGQLGLFKIKHETAVAAGVRRIEAVAGSIAFNLVQETFSQLHQIKEALKNPKETIKAIDSLQTENSVLKKKMERLEAKQLQVTKQGLHGKVQSLGSVNFIGEIVEVSNAESLRKLCADLKPMLNNYVVLLVANIEGKP
ncbi:MAG: alanine--tRNA ligase, partial [Chitinophagaceae bacterium]|nr:alanine--tRNA ligase [Chitinophagaceae bacterium]